MSIEHPNNLLDLYLLYCYEEIIVLKQSQFSYLKTATVHMKQIGWNYI